MDINETSISPDTITINTPKEKIPVTIELRSKEKRFPTVKKVLFTVPIIIARRMIVSPR